jgi:hypothetical protein
MLQTAMGSFFGRNCQASYLSWIPNPRPIRQEDTPAQQFLMQADNRGSFIAERDAAINSELLGCTTTAESRQVRAASSRGYASSSG